MAKQISEEVNNAVKDLIKQMSGLEEGTNKFTHLLKPVVANLKKADTMYFLNKREVDESIESMAKKFIFHGFAPQAKGLEDAYKAYVTEYLPKSELTIRLNIVKFLLCMSERPTSNFLEKPDEFVTEVIEEEEKINWGEYLTEGIERWSPNFDDTDMSSGSSFLDDISRERENLSGSDSPQVPLIIDNSDKEAIVELRSNREELLATIQHTWYNQEQFHMAPYSEWREANIGILWEDFLEDQVKGLVPIERASILSEYKVIREILWQLWGPHTSTVFEVVVDKLIPKSNVTISSVRSPAFEIFLSQFIPYIEVLDFFREFSKSLEIQSDDLITAVPQTFRSYNNSLQNIIRPLYRKLSELEDVVRQQETTYTLLNLIYDLEVMFAPIMLLKKIHNDVALDVEKNTHVRCATVLISKLHYSLQYTASKLEQDLRMTLFLESLYHYFTLIDSWLMKNCLLDYSEEFLIVNKNRNFYSTPYDDEEEESELESDNWKLKFDLRSDVDDFCAENGIIKIIRTTVLQLGRNIHLLRLLGKYSLINDCKESIHQEFVRRSLEELCKFFEKDPRQFELKKVEETEEVKIEIGEKNYKYPVVWTDQNRPTEMDKLDNLVDTSDGFLMLAFKEYLIEQPKKTEVKAEPSLFEKVSSITTTMFPTMNVFENILNDILKDRFTISGLMVKNILIEEYLLEKQFQFLRHTFMFFDDLIFPFYRNLFENTMTIHKNWGNDVWLTSHLQDIIMDIYPEFYEKCVIQVKENWRQCTESLDACTMVGLQYEIQWPLNIIITSPQMALYKGIFQFVLKIKWALYTINHLAFTDLEPKKLNKRVGTTHRTTIMKLKYLKFALTNILNSIQHYLFSFVFSQCLQRFELDFEKANDLSSIIASHATFINTVYGFIMDIKSCGKNSGVFRNIINCVKMLKVMWNNIEYATPARLTEYYKIYNECYKAVDPIICPVYIYSY